MIKNILTSNTKQARNRYDNFTRKMQDRENRVSTRFSQVQVRNLQSTPLFTQDRRSASNQRVTELEKTYTEFWSAFPPLTAGIYSSTFKHRALHFPGQHIVTKLFQITSLNPLLIPGSSLWWQPIWSSFLCARQPTRPDWVFPLLGWTSEFFHFFPRETSRCKVASPRHANICYASPENLEPRT